MSAVVLVVDDDPIPAALFMSVLEGYGYGVRYAPDAETALEMVALDPPSVLVLDLILPGIDGLEMLHRLREDPITQDLAVVLTSSGGQGLRRAAAAEANRTRHTWFVEKGASIDEFLAAVATALTAPR